jgi:hypothetical protein
LCCKLGYASEDPAPGSLSPYGILSGYSGCDVEVVIAIDEISMALQSAAQLLNGKYRFSSVMPLLYEGTCGQHFSFMGVGVDTSLNATGGFFNSSSFGISAASGPSAGVVSMLGAALTAVLLLLTA